MMSIGQSMRGRNQEDVYYATDLEALLNSIPKFEIYVTYSNACRSNTGRTLYHTFEARQQAQDGNSETSSNSCEEDINFID